MSVDIPTNTKNNFGSIALTKGSISVGKERLQLVVWDAVEDCKGERCVIEEKCHYQKTGRCTLQFKYVSNIIQGLVEEMETVGAITPSIMNTIGLHIVPLYGHLVKFKILELGLDSPSYFTEKGGIKIHPVYKEIRETLRSITIATRSLRGSVSDEPLEKFLGAGTGEDTSDWCDNLFDNTDASETTAGKEAAAAEKADWFTRQRKQKKEEKPVPGRRKKLQRRLKPDEVFEV